MGNKSSSQNAASTEESFLLQSRGPPSDGTEQSKTPDTQYGEASRVKIVSWLDICAVFTSLVALVGFESGTRGRMLSISFANAREALAILVIYHKTFAIYLGVRYQLTALGLLLSLQGLCTARQFQLCAVFLCVRYAATLQNLDSLLRNSLFTRNAGILVRTSIFVALALPPLLGALYKQFLNGKTTNYIPSITGQFGMIPPPSLDSLNGNGIALAVNRMTPFWQNRHKGTATYGENMLVLDEHITAMLDTPMIHTFQNLRGLLSRTEWRSQSLLLSADVNATVLSRMPILAEERSTISEAFDAMECESSNFFWCVGLGDGWWAAMVLGGVHPARFPPAASPSVNYIGIWRGPGHKFSDEAQKFVTRRRMAHGAWRVDLSTIKLERASILSDTSEITSQIPVSSKPLGLGLFGQLLQEYNYKWYDFNLTKSSTSFMASITWARLATLTIEDRNHQKSWYEFVNYTKSSNEENYTLQLEAQTVSRSPLLVLIFVIHPMLIVAATVVRACLYKTPVSDGVNTISLLSAASHSGLSILGGAGYSGELKEIVRIQFDVESAAEPHKEDGKVSISLHASNPTSPMGEVEAHCQYK